MGRSARMNERQKEAYARGRRAVRLVAALAAALPCPGSAAQRAASLACPLTAFAIGRVQAVIDGRTFVLDDGREVRLAGIETPPLQPAARDDTAGSDSAAALRRLIGENEIVLKHLTRQSTPPAAPASDRYGRLIAYAFVLTPSGETSLARELVAQGQALVAARKGEGNCVHDAVAAERAARAAKLGLWGDPRYELKRAENPADVLAVRGRYTLVEGEVLSVRESGGTIYINFGRRWTEDFTVTISKRNERMFAEAGLAPQRLQGRRVQVRGVIEERGGPWIEAMRPEQIEVVGGN